MRLNATVAFRRGIHAPQSRVFSAWLAAAVGHIEAHAIECTRAQSVNARGAFRTRGRVKESFPQKLPPGVLGRGPRLRRSRRSDRCGRCFPGGADQESKDGGDREIPAECQENDHPEDHGSREGRISVIRLAVVTQGAKDSGKGFWISQDTDAKIMEKRCKHARPRADRHGSLLSTPIGSGQSAYRRGRQFL